ncbi:DUF1499 domain-containing protein [Salsuginibacillus kocurii]|uniref:DUF1499 domain-containing protein n=1 Tax=Salsuginibacillus kocurii TaxID=427078 RepID=UPI00037759B1|nr:DUF1499 domain-containing protein [Salsuginibacillus kocurii]
MEMGYKLTRFWKDGEETRDHTSIEELQTRYYRASQKDVLQSLETVVKKNIPGEVVSVDQERGEMVIDIQERSRRYDMVITVVTMEFREVAVDVVSTVRNRKGDLGKNRQWIAQVYGALDRSFERKQ